MVSGPFNGHTESVISVAFSPDGKRIVSGSPDWTVRIWDSESGEPVAGPFNGHSDMVTSVAFFRDGKRIVSGSWDRTIRVWYSESGEAVPSSIKQSTLRSAHTGDPIGLIPLWNLPQTDGWLTSPSSELLIWLPRPLRHGLWSPNNTLVIGGRQTRLILDHVVHGSEWAKCWAT
ncbi:WD40 repeat-like protein [Mycena olivaceomarginata]|nr:WD40 repeat-like protein [Mycena olivaceomarginata]